MSEKTELANTAKAMLETILPQHSSPIIYGIMVDLKVPKGGNAIAKFRFTALDYRALKEGEKPRIEDVTRYIADLCGYRYVKYGNISTTDSMADIVNNVSFKLGYTVVCNRI
jgi:hypothetical protein